ncbi:hypothetical protein EJB05_04575, partial [Eragrostis curvula]
MGGVPEVARVRRETLAARLTCPLCHGLLREATAITECLHAFCRECIMKEINDEDADHCPVCNIDLGCDPEEKLRPDHNLQDLRNKLFPIKRDSPKPAKRKQRSLASLVVDTPNVEIKAGLTGKRTKATRRRTAPRATSPNKTETVKLPTKTESQDHKNEKQSAPQSPEVATTANKKQRNTDIDAPKKPLPEDRKNGKTTDKEEIQKPNKSKTKSPKSSPKIRAVMEELIKNKEGELPIRKEDTKNEAASSVTRLNKSRLSKEGKKGSSSEPASSKEKTRTEDNLKQEGSATTNSSHGIATTPVWFSLVSSSNQKEDSKLPPLSKSYLRIKDRCLQVSSVQKYIMTKLDLANEDEVEITCHGEPICSSRTLHGLIEFWVRRERGEPIQASFDAPAKEFVMVLGYRRRQRAPAPALAVPPAPILQGQLHQPQLTETAPAALLHPQST